MRYRVKALASGGAVAELRLEAATPDQAGLLARERGLSVISVRRDLSPAHWFAPRQDRFPLLLFAQQFIALLDAGLGTVESLEAMSGEAARSAAARCAACSRRCTRDAACPMRWTSSPAPSRRCSWRPSAPASAPVT